MDQFPNFDYGQDSDDEIFQNQRQSYNQNYVQNQNMFLSAQESEIENEPYNVQQEFKSSDNFKRGKNQKAEIKTVIRTFCIIIMVFATTFIGKSVHAIVTNQKKEADVITVETSRMNAELSISFKANLSISRIVYAWNNGTNKIISGEGRTSIQIDNIDIPYGNATLTIIVFDHYETEHKYTKTYINTSSDQTKPEITVSAEQKSLIITATDASGIAYLSYYWEGNQANTTVYKPEDLPNKYQVEIPLEQATQTNLIITAIDGSNNQKTITQPITSTHKPTVTLSLDGNTLVINAKDDFGLQFISVTIDGVTQEAKLDGKEANANIGLESGSHTVTVRVTNTSGLAEEQSATVELQ